MSDLPAARLERQPRFSFVWIVPILCLGMVAVFAYRHHQSQGPLIAIHFPDADGLTAGKTRIKFRGVTVGQVTQLEIEPSSTSVRVLARLNRDAADLARVGTVFVIVKPQVSFEGVEGLTTIFSGATLDLRPGTGVPAADFPGYSDARTLERDEPGLLLMLTAPQVGKITAGDGVFYRGLRVGDVTGVSLSRTAQNVVIDLKIKRSDERLVRTNTRFWEVAAIDAKIGLLGAKIKMGSLQELWTGGITFATPEPPGREVKSGTAFVLESKPDPASDKWSPKL